MALKIAIGIGILLYGNYLVILIQTVKGIERRYQNKVLFPNR
jgi:hypothetical protein